MHAGEGGSCQEKQILYFCYAILHIKAEAMSRQSRASKFSMLSVPSRNNNGKVGDYTQYQHQILQICTPPWHMLVFGQLPCECLQGCGMQRLFKENRRAIFDSQLSWGKVLNFVVVDAAIGGTSILELLSIGTLVNIETLQCVI